MAATRRWHALIPWGAGLLFLIYAITFLCFFVDDEAITFVYAQNLIRGRGLTYSAFEGPTEGYSNLLHVGVTAAILALVNALGLPKIASLFVAKALSLACGVVLVVLVGRTVCKVAGGWPPKIAALAVLALAGPVAVWSCSGLETLPFTLLFIAFLLALLREDDGPGWAELALGTAVLLARIDGFAYAGIACAAALCIASPPRRWILLTRVAVPLGGVVVLYNAWRYWYFGSLLSLPLQTKVLYRVLPHEALVSYLPGRSYLARFLELYHPVPLLLLAAGWLPFWRGSNDRRPFAIVIVAALLTVYAGVVTDWMFGFRFFVALFPLISLLAAYSLAAVWRRAPRLGVLLMVAVLVWSGSTALAFVSFYERADRWRSWWSHPTIDPVNFFGVFYPMYRDARSRIPPGTVTINNSAGFLPFLLDLENIDDVGLCSRFFAGLPTADIIFTEVGRYHALTNRPPLRAGDRYLVYRDARYLITLTNRLLYANYGHFPGELLGGNFRLALQSDHEVLYERTTPPRRDWQVRDFLENLAHPARVRLAFEQGVQVPRADMLERLPFLAAGREQYSLSDVRTFELHLNDDPIYELWIDAIYSTANVRMDLTLYRADGGVILRDAAPITARTPFRYHRLLERPGPGSVFVMRLSRIAEEATITISDVRVLGQPPALRKYIEGELFRAPAIR